MEKELDIDYDRIDNTSNISNIERIFIKEAHQYRVLSADEQLELFKKYKENKDQESYQKLINHNLRLSINIANKYKDKCQTMSFLDLVQECNLALMAAIEGYDISKNTAFSTYAVKAMITNLIGEIKKQDNNIPKTKSFEKKLKEYKKYLETYYEKNNKYPTDEEIISNLHIFTSTLQGLRAEENYNTISLNEKVGEEATDELIDLVASDINPYDNLINQIDGGALFKSTQEILSNKEYYVIYNRIIADKEEQKTLEVIGEEFDISREGVRLIEIKSLKKIRKSLKRVKREIFSNYSISELKEINIVPLSPQEISTLYYLKSNLNKELYKYFYDKKVLKIETNNYLEELSIEDRNKIIKIENKYFNKEKMETIFKKLKKKKTIDQIFDLNLDLPIKQKVKKK